MRRSPKLLGIPNGKRPPRRHRDANNQDQSIVLGVLLVDGDLCADGSNNTHEESEERAEDTHHGAELWDGD